MSDALVQRPTLFLEDIKGRDPFDVLHRNQARPQVRVVARRRRHGVQCFREFLWGHDNALAESVRLKNQAAARKTAAAYTPIAFSADFRLTAEARKFAHGSGFFSKAT